MKRISTLNAAVAVCLAPSLASAGLIFDDGGAHSINSATPGSILLRNGSEVRLGNGAIVNGDGSNNTAGGGGQGAIGAEYPGISRIHVGGDARVSTGLDQNAISRLGAGALSITDDSVITGNVYGWGFDHTSLHTQLGGNAVINGNLRTDGTLSIAGNARVNGSVAETNGGVSLRMAGGTVTGNVQAGSLVSHSAYIESGTIEGAYRGTASDVDFSMRGGSLLGGYAINSASQHVELHGGAIGGGMKFTSMFDDVARNSSVSLFGGSIDVGAGGYLLDFGYSFDAQDYSAAYCGANTSTFSIWGGQLGHTSAGNGLHLDFCATLDIYGTNLSYASGLLTGLLADGSVLNLAVTEESRWGGALRLHDVSVPEPGTLGLFATALGALGFARRRKATTS